MIYSLRKPGSYNRQYNDLVNTINLQINNEQAQAAAMANRLTGNTAPPPEQVQDRRSSAEKRLDMIYQTGELRKNLLKIMDANEAGQTADRLTRSINALKLVTTINQQWNGIQTDLKKVYTDVSPSIFIEFVNDYLAAGAAGQKAGTDIVGTKGHKSRLIDQIMRGFTTFHIGMDAILDRLRRFFGRGGKVVKYPQLAEDFQYIAEMKNIIPLPDQRAKERLNEMSSEMLRGIEEILSFFPTLQQTNQLINKYFNRNGSDKFETGKTFANLMKDIFVLYGVSPPIMSQLQRIFEVTAAELASLPRITMPAGETPRDIDALSMETERFLDSGDAVFHPLTDPTAVATYPVIQDIQDTSAPMEWPQGPASTALVAGPGAAAAAAPPIGAPGAPVIAPFEWYKPPGGWTFPISSATVSEQQWNDIIAELEAPLITQAKLIDIPWSQTDLSQRNSAFLVQQYNIRFNWAATVDQNAARDVLGFSSPTLSDAMAAIDALPNAVDAGDQFMNDVGAGYDALPTTVGPAGLGINPFEWFAPPVEYTDGTIDPGYLASGESSWETLIKSNGIEESKNLMDWYATKFNFDPEQTKYPKRLTKSFFMKRMKDLLNNSEAAQMLALNQQSQALDIQQNATMPDPKTSFEFSAFLEKLGFEPLIPFKTDPAYRQLITGYAATLPDTDFGMNALTTGEDLFAESAPAAAVPTIAAAPDVQADLGIMGAPQLENILPPPAQPGAEQEGEVVEGLGLRSGTVRMGNRRVRNIVGRGMNPYFVPTAGIEPEQRPRYATFGRMVINVEKLDAGKLCLKIPRDKEYKSIIGLPIMTISGLMCSILKELIATKNFNYLYYVRLPSEEQELMATIVHKCSLPIQLPTEDHDFERFELLKAHILAGGTSRQEIKEFKEILFKFVRQGRIGHKAALSIIEELNDL